jgi:hypothetical protein
VSQSTDASRGAVTVYAKPDLVSLNSSGCIALVDGDATANGCGATDQALHDCKASSCSGCDTNASFSAYQACESLAESSDCATEKSDRTSKCGELTNATGALATCLGNGLSQHNYVTAIAAFFCGGADGG